jgi:integrase
MLTQALASPSSIEKFGLALINNWGVYSQILKAGPSEVRVLWDELVQNVDVAKAGKAILKLASNSAVGTWLPLHSALVKSLDTRAKAVLLSQRGKVKRRERLLSANQQSTLTRVLDDAAEEQSLPPEDAEGLTALALIYQHAMRPVQLLAIRMEHVRLVQDATQEWACILSFHTAKQPDGKAYEVLRQVKPEWVPLIQQLVVSARQAGRQRLFASTNVEKLWSLLRSACRQRAFRVDFTANTLRHTAAQALADAGQDRESIRRFLTHTNENAARVYQRGSLQQGKRINEALGVSKLYQNVLNLAERKFVSIDELLSANEDQQIGGIVGERLVGGLGICRTGQSSCRYNPVTSCYGCSKFIPSGERAVHEEAVAGIREQVMVYVNFEQDGASPAYRQLTRALAGAQQTIDTIDGLGGCT